MDEKAQVERKASRKRSASYLAQFKKKSALTSVDFMKVWHHYDRDNNGKIESGELEMFLMDLIRVQPRPVDPEQVHELKENLLAMYDADNDGRLSIQEMASILPTEENFLLQFRVKSKLTSVDFMRVWRHYDQDRNGQIDSLELEGFLKDLMEKQGNEASIENIKDYAKTMTDLFDSNKDGKLEIYDLLNILPVEYNFLLNFKGKSRLNKKDFCEIFSHYDTDGNGVIEDDELLALLQDLVRRENESASFTDLQLYQQCILEMCDLNGDGKVELNELALLLSRQ